MDYFEVSFEFDTISALMSCASKPPPLPAQGFRNEPRPMVPMPECCRAAFEEDIARIRLVQRQTAKFLLNLSNELDPKMISIQK